MMHIARQVTAILAMAVIGLQAADNLVPATALETGFTGWNGLHGAWELSNVQRLLDGERPFLRFQADKPVILELRIAMQPAWQALKLSFDGRRQGVVQGKDAWNIPNAELNFLDGDGKDLLNWTRANWQAQNTEGWQPFERVYEVPAGAVTLVATLSMWQAKAGTADFSRVRIEAVRQRPVEEARAVQQQLDNVHKEQAVARTTPETLAQLSGLSGGAPGPRPFAPPTTEPVAMTAPLLPPPVTGSTYFVSALGDNTGDGSQAKPWKTIQHGLDQLQPGDRLFVREGEYKETNLTFARSGTPEAYITVSGYPGEQATIIGGGSIATFNLDSGDLYGSGRPHHHLVIRDLRIDAQGCNNAVRIYGPMLSRDPRGAEFRSKPATARDATHSVWVINNEITGGGHGESVIGVGYGAHHAVISNNRITRSRATAINVFLQAYGSIVEWNTVTDTSADADDAGAIKSMTPMGVIRYNTVHGNSRSRTSPVPGWAPDEQGGKQWNHLQGVTGIYLDWAMAAAPHNPFQAGELADPAVYVYGNRVFGNNGGIYAFQSDHAVIFDNIVHGNGRNGMGGFTEGDPGKKWLPFGGPAGRGISVGNSKQVRVFRNLVFDNARDGIAEFINTAGNEYYDNTVFANDELQLNLGGGEDVLTGGNRILANPGEAVRLHFLGWNYADFNELRKTHPHNDAGSEILVVEGDRSALLRTAMALPARRGGEAESKTWEATRAKLQAAGKLTVKVRKPGEAVPQAPYDPTHSLQQPLPWPLPGKLEFENFDEGGQDVSYHDSDPTNQGGHYRRELVDIKSDPNCSNGAVVGFTTDGEWMDYTVQTQAESTFRLKLGYAAGNEAGTIRLSIGDKPIGQTITLAATGSWDKLATADGGSVTLPAGISRLRVTIVKGPVDLDVMQFSK